MDVDVYKPTNIIGVHHPRTKSDMRSQSISPECLRDRFWTGVSALSRKSCLVKLWLKPVFVQWKTLKNQCFCRMFQVFWGFSQFFQGFSKVFQAFPRFSKGFPRGFSTVSRGVSSRRRSFGWRPWPSTWRSWRKNGRCRRCMEIHGEFQFFSMEKWWRYIISSLTWFSRVPIISIPNYEIMYILWDPNYPLVKIQKAIEHDHRNSGFTH